MMLQLTFGLTVAALVLLQVGGATTVVRRETAIDVASAKYDSGGGSYGGSGYSSGGGGGGGYGGGGGGSYGSSGYGSSGGGGGGYGGGGSSYGGGGYGDGGGGGGNGGSYDTGNVYYYYYPTSASSSNSYGPSSGGSSYYGMSGGGGGGGDKDKDGGILSSLVNLATPAVLAVVLGIPLLLLTLLGILGAIAFVIGRSNDGYSDAPAGLGGIGGLVDLGLVRGVHEAFAAYQALTTDENCRQRVVCELGYILKASDKRATVVSVLDAMLPASLQKHFKPLKEVMASGESGKCQKYVCNAAAAALKAGPLSSIFGSGSKGTTSTAAPSPAQDAETQHSPPATEDSHHNH